MADPSEVVRLTTLPYKAVRQAEMRVELTDEALQFSGEHLMMLQPVLFAALLSSVEQDGQPAGESNSIARYQLMGTFAGHQLLYRLSEDTDFTFPEEQATGDVNADGEATYGYLEDALHKNAEMASWLVSADDPEPDYIGVTTSIRTFARELPAFYDSGVRLGSRAFNRPLSYFRNYLKTGWLMTAKEVRRIQMQTKGPGLSQIERLMTERRDFTEFLAFFGSVIGLTAAAQDKALFEAQFPDS